jgi:hypothetical protein
VKPVELDEYPVHQTPLSMARVGTSDRNFYDRYYFNGHDRTGERFLVAGFGVYPNLGVLDGFVTLREGDTQTVARFSDGLEGRSLRTSVGGMAIEVLEPLQRLRLTCESDALSCDLTWEGSYPAVLEDAHLLMSPLRPTLDASRFAQTGSWEGSITVGGTKTDVSPDVWVGTRDRSWGIRPVGDPDPAGRLADHTSEGFWWLYVPMRFETFQLILIVQEEPTGHRTLSHASRIFADGRIEQLGWPRIEIDYASGTRHPTAARIHLTRPDGTPLVLEVETKLNLALHVGCGYGGDPDWSHGQWKGANWGTTSTYDYNDPAVAGRVPWGVVEHVGRATLDGEEGWGLFEHGSIGRHDPTGFADYLSVAP